MSPNGTAERRLKDGRAAQAQSKYFAVNISFKTFKKVKGEKKKKDAGF